MKVTRVATYDGNDEDDARNDGGDADDDDDVDDMMMVVKAGAGSLAKPITHKLSTIMTISRQSMRQPQPLD